MKKSVIVVIVSIFIASIVLISFYGIKIKSYNEQIYADEIEILNEEFNENTNAIVLLKNKNWTHIPFEYQIDLHVKPNSATNKSVSYTIDENPEYYTIDNKGLLTIKSETTFKVIIRTLDGSRLKKEVQFDILNFDL